MTTIYEDESDNLDPAWPRRRVMRLPPGGAELLKLLDIQYTVQPGTGVVSLYIFRSDRCKSTQPFPNFEELARAARELLQP